MAEIFDGGGVAAAALGLLIEEVSGSGKFMRDGRTGEGEPVGAIDYGLGGIAGFGEDAGGEVAGLLVDEGAVHECEGLGGNGGGHAARRN